MFQIRNVLCSLWKSYIWLIQTICKSKVYIFLQKNSTWTQNTEKNSMKYRKKLKQIPKKLKVLSQKLLATEARCLSMPPLCVEKKSLFYVQAEFWITSELF